MARYPPSGILERETLAKNRKKPRHDRYGSKRKPFRDPLPVVVIVCDDSTVAPAYFNELKKVVKQKLTVQVDKASCSESSPEQVVLKAEQHLGALDDPNDRQSVWVLFDREGSDKQQDAADRITKNAVDVGIKVAVSHPCYDLWTLLHFEDTGSYFENCKKVVDRLIVQYNNRFETKVDRKTEIAYEKLIDDRLEASARAKRHHEAGDQSWTEVYKVIEEIDSFIAAESTGDSHE